MKSNGLYSQPLSIAELRSHGASDTPLRFIGCCLSALTTNRVKKMRFYADLWGKNWTVDQLELEYAAN